MGLDISGYSHIQVKGTSDYDEDLESSDINQEWINPDFPHAVSLDGETGNTIHWVKTPETEYHGFRAGSYGGYGIWRATLAGIFLLTDDLYTDQSQWNKVFDSEGKPFYELINFSDCEGTFYGPVCEKIYRDFVDNREIVAEIESNIEYPAWDQDWFMNLYDDWTRVFELASQNGLVSFH